MLSDKAIPLVDYIETILAKVPDDPKEGLSHEFCDDYVQAISMLAKPQLIFGMNNVKPKDDNQSNLLSDIPLNVVQPTQPAPAKTDTPSNTKNTQVETNAEETQTLDAQIVEETDNDNDSSNSAFSVLDDF